MPAAAPSFSGHFVPSWATSSAPRSGLRKRNQLFPPDSSIRKGPDCCDTGTAKSCPLAPASLPTRGRSAPLGEAGFPPRGSAVPTTAQDVFRSPSPRDSTRSTEGSQRASEEAAVVRAGVSLPSYAASSGRFGALSSPDSKTGVMENLAALVGVPHGPHHPQEPHLCCDGSEPDGLPGRLGQSQFGAGGKRPPLPS